LPDELHIALADGVKGVHGVSFLRPPPGTQGSGPLRPVRYRCAELDDLNLHVKSPLANDLASRFGDRHALTQLDSGIDDRAVVDGIQVGA